MIDSNTKAIGSLNVNLSKSTNFLCGTLDEVIERSLREKDGSGCGDEISLSASL